MDTLSLIYMKYFCDAVKLNGVTAAAKCNFVTQSAISQGIRRLEEALKCSLVASHPNRFRITPEGELAFQYMSKILHQTSEFQKSFSEESKNAIGNLEFACMFSFAYTVIPSYLKKFQLFFPSTHINLQCSGNPDEIKQWVMSGSVDFGILPSFDFRKSDTTRFEKRVIYDIKTELFVSRKIKPKEEKDLKFIIPEDFEKEALFDHLYDQQYGKKPEIFLRVPSWVLAARLATEGLGIAYLPNFVALDRTYNLRPYKSNLKFPTIQAYLIYPYGMKLRKSSQIFLANF